MFRIIWSSQIKGRLSFLREDIGVIIRGLKFNLLRPGVPFLYPLKVSENLGFSDVFRGYKQGTLGSNVLSEQLEESNIKLLIEPFHSI